MNARCAGDIIVSYYIMLFSCLLLVARSGSRNGHHVSRSVEAATALSLSKRDYEEIEHVTARAAGVRGDVYELERDLPGRHGRIMR
jgi:hypothetical protein